MQFSEQVHQKLKKLPDGPGVYLMRNRQGKIIYIGKAVSLRKRVQSYFRESTLRKAQPKVRGLIRSINDFDFIELKSDAEALITESRLINEYKPRYNTLLKDDKRFLLIRIYLNQPFPRFETCRIQKTDGATYFGPYTSSSAVKAAIDFMDKRFGFRRCKPIHPDAETYRHCLDDIIRDCSAPCIEGITQSAYLERVQEACAFLRGERFGYLTELQAEMESAAQKLDFEQAAALRDMLLLLRKAMKERARAKKTRATKEIEAVQGVRQLQLALKLESPPKVIECFDISNISGTLAVASMVCAVNGVPTPQRYRRFRIKTVEGSDDPAMMAEVVERRYGRLQSENKAMPDLVLVDGGITQLRAARRVLDELGLPSLPLAGLAKRYEEVVWDIENKQPPIRLPRDSDALIVLTNLRDEAHRFAITYHRKLRNQRIRESMLDEINGIGDSKKKLILTHFGSIARLKKASLAELASVPGIGPKTAVLIQSELNRLFSLDPGEAPSE
jgi:excinuclease ABC subunit C